MFAWCSIWESTTRSSGPTFARPHEYATRLIASVAFFVNTVSPTVEPVNRATRSRASSYASVASVAIA